jgi:hypothetical protein
LQNGWANAKNLKNKGFPVFPVEMGKARRFWVDERGNVDLKLCAGFVRDEKAVEGHRTPRRWRVDR